MTHDILYLYLNPEHALTVYCYFNRNSGSGNLMDSEKDHLASYHVNKEFFVVRPLFTEYILKQI